MILKLSGKLNLLKTIVEDIREISIVTYQEVRLGFGGKSDSETDSENLDFSDSDSSDYDWEDNSNYICGDITTEIEQLVDENWRSCHPIEDMFGETASAIKSSVLHPKDEGSCVGIKMLGGITNGEDRSLIATCTDVCFWCCCETIKRVSPVIAEATTNLIL